jgi:DNA-binding NarL/FixJ family response regulator
VRPDWTVIPSAVNAFSMAMRLPPAGKQMVIIGAPDSGLALSTAEKLQSLRPATPVILLADFESPASKEQAKKHAQAVVSRSTELAGGVLAAVEELLQGHAFGSSE